MLAVYEVTGARFPVGAVPVVFVVVGVVRGVEGS